MTPGMGMPATAHERLGWVINLECPMASSRELRAQEPVFAFPDGELVFEVWYRHPTGVWFVLRRGPWSR